MVRLNDSAVSDMQAGNFKSSLEKLKQAEKEIVDFYESRNTEDTWVMKLMCLTLNNLATHCKK